MFPHSLPPSDHFLNLTHSVFRLPTMSLNTESKPPPMIAKMGPYTVFVTPPQTPHSPPPALERTLKVGPPPPVQPPPLQFHKPIRDASVLGFLKNAAMKVQSAHSRLDGHLARWLGLDQSKYQWVLEDYYESKKFEKENPKKQGA